MFTSAIFASLAALLYSTSGLVDARTVRRDVVSPPITYPTTGTVWNVNERHNVTWDTSVIPPGFTSTGMIVLGFLDDADGDNEHLDLDHPLAQGFPITNGRTEITVPSVTTRNTYILVLFGDSGNASNKFTIKNISIGTSPTSSINSVTASGTVSSSPSSTSDDSSSASNSQATSAASSSEAVSPSQKGSAPVSGSASGSASGTASVAKATSTAPGSSVSGASGSSTSQTSPAAQSAGSATTSPNAGVRAASLGRVTTWLPTMCSFAVVAGLAF